MLVAKSQQSTYRMKGVAWIVFLLGLMFLLWRAPYGFCFNDEPFCLTLAQRMWNGDALIVDEWHGTQNFGSVLLPLYAVFRLLSSNNEGLFLLFRYVYCICWWLTCVYTSHRLAKWTPGYTGILSFVYLILFSPLDYMSMSYTSVGLMCSLLLCSMFLLISPDKPENRYGGGLVFSDLWIVLTLCSPIMAVAYVFVFLIGMTGSLWERNKIDRYYFRNLFYLCKFSAVLIAFCVAGYLYIFVLSRANFLDIFKNLPYIFKDPEHQNVNLRETLYSILYACIADNGIYFMLMGVSFFAGFAKCVRKYRLAIFAICTLMYVYVQIDYMQNKLNTGFNQQVLYIVLLGAVAFSMLEHKPVKPFVVFYGFSSIYTICNCLMSNTGLMSISMTLFVAGSAGIGFICLLMMELYESCAKDSIFRYISVILVCVIMLVQIGTQIFTRLYRTYWDAPLGELSQTIGVGAAKGLKTTPERVEAYETLYENLTVLLNQTNTEGKTFESWTSAPYLYLDANLDFATFSAWSFGYGDELNQRISSYQRVNPNKVPDLIFYASPEDKLSLDTSDYDTITYQDACLLVKRTQE